MFYMPTGTMVKNESISELTSICKCNVYYLYNSRLPNRNGSLYFQLQVVYYSNKTKKNKYKNVQLMASTKNNLKIAEEQIAQGVHLQRQILKHCCLG